MGRHRKMASGNSSVAESTPVSRATGQEAPRHGDADTAPWCPAIEPHQVELYHYLVQVPVGVPIKGLAAITPVAAAMVVQAPAVTRETDRKRLVLMCQLLAHDRDMHGDIDLRRAMHRVHVDHYVRSGSGSQTSGTIAAYSSHFYRFGRLLHPAEYPAPREPLRRTRVQRPYSPAEVQALYRRHLSLTDHLADRLLTMLDLATGVGARSDEMVSLTGSSVRQIPTGGGASAVCVELPSRRTGVIRTIPVLGASKAGRLWRRAQVAGPDGYLLEGGRRNAVNGVQRAIRARGVSIDISAVRLRYFWIVEIAHRPIPVATFLQLADLGDSHSLHELSRHMRGYEPDEVAAIMAGALA